MTSVSYIIVEKNKTLANSFNTVANSFITVKEKETKQNKKAVCNICRFHNVSSECLGRHYKCIIEPWHVISNNVAF